MAMTLQVPEVKSTLGVITCVSGRDPDRGWYGLVPRGDRLPRRDQMARLAMWMERSAESRPPNFKLSARRAEDSDQVDRSRAQDIFLSAASATVNSSSARCHASASVSTFLFLSWTLRVLAFVACDLGHDLRVVI